MKVEIGNKIMSNFKINAIAELGTEKAVSIDKDVLYDVGEIKNKAGVDYLGLYQNERLVGYINSNVLMNSMLGACSVKVFK